jgi:hypothetical protein
VAGWLAGWLMVRGGETNYHTIQYVSTISIPPFIYLEVCV